MDSFDVTAGGAYILFAREWVEKWALVCDLWFIDGKSGKIDKGQNWFFSSSKNSLGSYTMHPSCVNDVQMVPHNSVTLTTQKKQLTPKADKSNGWLQKHLSIVKNTVPFISKV